MELLELNDKDKQLIKLALEVIEKNYDSKTYNHTVGSAVRCTDGSVYLGVNCDGNHGSCAEYIAIGNAVTNGKRDFDTIVAVAPKTLNNLLPPCGNCRQMMIEYCPTMKVILNDTNGNMVKAKITDLLPLAYVHTHPQ